MVGRSVTFDREHVAAGLVRMANGDIDLEPSGADLLVDLVVEALYDGSDRFLERRIRVLGRRNAFLKDAGLGVLQEALEDTRPFGNVSR